VYVVAGGQTQQQARAISPWHDVPLGLEQTAQGSFEMWAINEIAKGTTLKMQTVVSDRGWQRECYTSIAHALRQQQCYNIEVIHPPRLHHGSQRK
jgi:hypothetical protein